LSEFKTKTEVDLDPQWVEDLLVTAFDGQYGGANYWLNGMAEEGDLIRVHIRTDEEDHWHRVELHLTSTADTRPEVAQPHVHAGCPLDCHAGVVVADKAALEYAWARIVDERPIRSDLVDQLTRSMHTGDLDVDAEAADCLVQIALFGEVVYA